MLEPLQNHSEFLKWKIGKCFGAVNLWLVNVGSSKQKKKINGPNEIRNAINENEKKKNKTK